MAPARRGTNAEAALSEESLFGAPCSVGLEGCSKGFHGEKCNKRSRFARNQKK